MEFRKNVRQGYNDNRSRYDQNGSGTSGRRESFFGYGGFEPKMNRTQQPEGQKQSTVSSGNMLIHRCSICGRTNLTNPELSFRYCSKCAGNHEYCQDHLFTHVHVNNE